MSILASLVRPVEPGRRAVVLTGRTWRLGTAVLPADAATADVLVLGRPPLPAGTPPSRAALSALRREMALARIRMRPPPGFRMADVHRLAPGRAGTGRIRSRVRRAALGGAAVELTADPPPPRLLDAVAAEAGVRLGSRIRPTSGGAALLLGTDREHRPVLMRLAPAGEAADPARAAGALRALDAASVPWVPRLLGEGVAFGMSWTLESVLAGRRPERLTERVRSEASALLSGFPRGDGRPAALDEDLSEIARLLPTRASALARVASKLGAPDLPAVLRHGDLWAGNLLTRRGRLSGLVDWDAWHPRGLPGADLLELYASGERLRARRPLGIVWRERPWDDPDFAAFSDGYWRALGLRPTRAQLEIIGIAWWAAKVAGTLRRLPERADDDGWLTEIVDPVLDLLSA